MGRIFGGPIWGLRRDIAVRLGYTARTTGEQIILVLTHLKLKLSFKLTFNFSLEFILGFNFRAEVS
jgi:hypothetical protein